MRIYTIIALLLLANVATFLFARSRVKVVEKIVRVHENSPEGKAPLSACPSRREACSKPPSLEVAPAYNDVLPDQFMDYEKDHLLDTVKAEEPHAENIEKDEKEEKGKNGAAGIVYALPYTVPSEENATLTAENIPIPELPILAANNEISTDENEAYDEIGPPIEIPRLPEESY